MKMILKKSAKICFVVFVFMLAILYLLASFSPWLNPRQFWLISLLGLIFPYLFFIGILMFIYFAVKRSRLCWLILGILLTGWTAISRTFGLTQVDSLSEMRVADDAIRVLGWNVFRWDELNSRGGKNAQSRREQMMEEVLKYDADILCFHEFFEPTGRGTEKFQKNIEAIGSKGYPYSAFFASSVIHSGTKKFGMAIFSKYPIGDSSVASFGKTVHSEGVMSVDVTFLNKKLRIVTTHLESFKIGKSTYFGSQSGGMFENSRASLWSVKQAYFKRADQATIVAELISKSPYPVIAYGNLGDVPVSNTYSLVRGDLKDGFLESGLGFGKTFNSMIPNLRVDYLFVDPGLRVKRFLTTDVTASDHQMLVADISIP